MKKEDKKELLGILLTFADRDNNTGGGYEMGYRACAEDIIEALKLELE